MVNYLENFVPLVCYEVNTVDNQLVVVVKREDLLVTLNNLKLHINSQYNLLYNISGVDLVELKYRFVVIYDLLSIKYSQRLSLKVFVNEITAVPSSVGIFRNANWWEREIWDMFGIYFQDHPDLRRILTDYGFQGFPLRKDFPLSGYVEVQYDESTKKVEVFPLTLTQEMRKYTYENPWPQAENDTIPFSVYTENKKLNEAISLLKDTKTASLN